MKRGLYAAAAVAVAAGAWAGEIRQKLVYAECYLNNDMKMGRLYDMVPRAAACGFTGVVLQGDLQYMWLLTEKQRARLQKLKKMCDDVGLEMIPAVWSIGYGAMLGADPNLAEGVPCWNIPYRVSEDGRKAVNVKKTLTVDFDAGFENPHMDGKGGFTLDGFKFTERPGQITFIDTEVKHSGKSSIRFDCAAADTEDRQARALLHLKVRPNSKYEVTLWFRTEDVRPPWSVQAAFYTAPRKGEVNGMTRSLSFTRPVIDQKGSTGGWKKVVAQVSTLEYDEVQLWFGAWGSPTGHVWVDDIEVRLAGLEDVLRRPGCPFSVKGADTQVVYEEGRDFDAVPPQGEAQKKAPRENGSLVLAIPAGSRIRPGERLLVSGYRAHYMKAGYQVNTCMSEPKLYELIEKSARSISDVLHPKTWFLPEDEIRAAGTCAACERLNKSMPDMFADCVNRMCATIRSVAPGARIYMWGDQLDPNMNGKGQNYLCKGSFEGAIDKVSHDIVVMHWGSKVPETLAYFRGHGFETGRSIADFDGPWTDRMAEIAKRNVQNAKDDPGCHAIMFTTWNVDYQNLERFAEYLK